MFRLQVAAIICDYCDLVREASPLPELLFFCKSVMSNHVVITYRQIRCFSNVTIFLRDVSCEGRPSTLFAPL